ncbi:pilus assembly protein [Streptomonospora sp. S1-112]|uniref:Pilus assembly protein n=1 Tax=Streptomonospora mangrovi TaxID=2883123 RepID=A0A9X3NN45_9ACTN|nr:TadE/TadG family type IV pilus assembly protein [Streptomonospora mangrovi]MDA0565173.1 pilus assembly protein [Streptomonospora mangrovi]
MTGGDKGAAAVEAALLTPLLIALVLLIVLAGRLASADLTVTATAHAAARAATLERTPAAAEAAAQRAAANNLRTHDLSCAAHSLRLDTGGLEPGATVRVRLTCRVDLGDLSGLGVPGTHTVWADSSAVVDLYRGTP